MRNANERSQLGIMCLYVVLCKTTRVRGTRDNKAVWNDSCNCVLRKWYLVYQQLEIVFVFVGLCNLNYSLAILLFLFDFFYDTWTKFKIIKNEYIFVNECAPRASCWLIIVEVVFRYRDSRFQSRLLEVATFSVESVRWNIHISRSWFT